MVLFYLGNFGSGVVTYFRFFKWLFQLNIAIFLLMFFFVTIPQLAAVSSSLNITASAIPENTTDADLIAIRCSDLYETNITSSTLWWEQILDLLQGTVSTKFRLLS